MDPNATLEHIRRLAREIEMADTALDYDYAASALELAELVRALDKWLSRGGLRPAVWSPVIPLKVNNSRKV